MSIHIHPIPMGMGIAYLIESAAGLLLVDAGLPHWEQAVLRRIHALGRKPGALQLIYITHAHLDHYGSAAALRRASGAPVVIHRADADAIARGRTPLGSIRGRGWLLAALLPLAERVLRPEPTLPDILCDDGDALDLDLPFAATVLHTSGHTPGSSCLIVEGEGDQDRIAFAGDLVSNTTHPHGQRYFAHDWAILHHNLARLQALHPQWVYPGHGRAPLDDATLQRLA